MKHRYFLPFGFVVGALALSALWPRPNVVSASPKPESLLSEICIGGCASGGADDDKVVVHHILVLANNPHTKFADWVAYKITAESIGHNCRRNWRRDPMLASDDTLEPRDFVGVRNALQSDRGHQAPLASICNSRYGDEANYLSNVTPQRSNLNEGAWEQLEAAERKLAQDNQLPVYVLTGPLYEHTEGVLPRAHLKHQIPSGYWKIVAIRDGNGVRAAAFIMAQETARGEDFCRELVTVREVETRSRLTIYPNMAGSERAKIENADKSTPVAAALGCQ